MAYELRLTTPHGIVLENAYCNIDFFSFTKRHEGLIFNMVFYRDREAYEEGLPALPDMIIGDTIPISEIDLEGNILQQIYEYATNKSKLSTDAEYFIEMQKTQEEPIAVDMQYALLKEATNVIDKSVSAEEPPIE
mgnify:CR=1 FL=1